MKPIHSIYLTAFCLLLGCSKYDEGPTLTLRSKKHRIEGKWSASSFLIDNEQEVNIWFEDQKSSVACQSGSSVYMGEKSRLTKLEWEMNKDGSASQTFTWGDVSIDYNGVWSSCKETYLPESFKSEKHDYTWEFDKHKENVIFTSSNGGYRLVYEILELREKEVKLKYQEGHPVKTFLYTLKKAK